MTCCDGREDDDERGWQDDDWKCLSTNEQGQEDALFTSLDEDELEDAQESAIDELFFMQSTDVPLDMVERLSWDAAGQSGSGDEDEETLFESRLSTHPPLQVDIALEDDQLQWGLISPCSETSSPRPSLSTMLSPLTSLSKLSPVYQRTFFKPELEHDAKASTQPMIEKEGAEVEEHEQEEEVTLHNPETCWPPGAYSVVSSPGARVFANPFATHDPETNTRPIRDSDNDNQPSPVASARRPSLLSRAPSIAKARTCSGVTMAGTPTSEASLSHLRNRSVGDEDDGDFSSDDEGYTPELHRCRASRHSVSSQWRRARHMSIHLPSHRLSMRPAVMTKRLQNVKDKLNSGLHLLRSGSSVSTVVSEESYLESPMCQEIKSAPSGIYREPSIFSDEATATSLVRAASACTVDRRDTHHPTRQQQLRTSVFRAAGLLNAASAEAARKLKSRGFRAPHLPRQMAASETEEEDLELSATAFDHCGALGT